MNEYLPDFSDDVKKYIDEQYSPFVSKHTSFSEYLPSEWATCLNCLSIGNVIEDGVRGKTFYDMGCGSQVSKKLLDFLSKLDIKNYIGVDTSIASGGISENDLKGQKINSDILKYIKTLPDGSGGTFLFSGIEEIGDNNDAEMYIIRMFSELNRVLNPGDLVIISGPSLLAVKSGKIDIRQYFYEIIIDEKYPGDLLTKIYAKNDASKSYN